MQTITPYATQDDITIYDEGSLLWTDCTQKVSIEPQKAYKSLEWVLEHLHEVLNDITPIQIENVNNENSHILSIGTVLSARACIGKLPVKKIQFKVVDVIEGNYLRLRVESFRCHLADLDFRIRQEDDFVKLSYRQGCTCKGMKNPIIPATADIYNVWLNKCKDN